MRLVPIEQAINALLAETIYDLNGRALITKGSRLTQNALGRVKEIGYASVYIHDQFSEEDVTPLIPTELRNEVLNGIKSLHGHIRQPDGKGLIIHNKIDDLFKLAQLIEYELNAKRSNTIDYIDIKSSLTYTYEHCITTAILAFLLSKSLGYSPQELSHIFIGALFHDIGMATIDESVFMKNGKLDIEEFIKIKEHPQRGHGLIKDLPQFSAYTKVIVLQHHEKLDGTGYPNKLLGKDIHPYAKIVSVCDIYDAMTSDRPYSKAVEPSKALEYLDSASNSQLDSVCALHFMRILMPYPPGTILKLSTNQLAVVKSNDPLWPLKPNLQVIDPVKKVLTRDIIELVNVPSITIDHVHYDKI